MRVMRGIGLAVLVLPALVCTPAQALQTPAQRRLESDRKKIYAEVRKEKKELNKLLGGLSHGTERVAHGQKKAEALRLDAGEIEKQIEADETGGGTDSPARLERLKAKETKLAAQLEATEQLVAGEQLAGEEQAAVREAGIATREAEIAKLEARIVKDEEEVAEGL